MATGVFLQTLLLLSIFHLVILRAVVKPHYNTVCFNALHIHMHICMHMYMFVVVNFDALAQVSDFRIVVFLC